MKIGPLEFACNFPDWLLTPGEHRLADRGGCGDLLELCVYVSMCMCVWWWQLHSRSSCAPLHTPHLSQGCPGWLMEHPPSSTKLRPTPGTRVEHLGASGLGPGQSFVSLHVDEEGQWAKVD